MPLESQKVTGRRRVNSPERALSPNDDIAELASELFDLQQLMLENPDSIAPEFTDGFEAVDTYLLPPSIEGKLWGKTLSGSDSPIITTSSQSELDSINDSMHEFGKEESFIESLDIFSSISSLSAPSTINNDDICTLPMLYHNNVIASDVQYGGTAKTKVSSILLNDSLSIREPLTKRPIPLYPKFPSTTDKNITTKAQNLRKQRYKDITGNKLLVAGSNCISSIPDENNNIAHVSFANEKIYR